VRDDENRGNSRAAMIFLSQAQVQG